MNASRAGGGSPLEVLRRRDFALYWSGQLVSLTGGWMQQLALSWVVLQLVSSAFALGAVNFLASIPPAILLLHGGVAADRFDRRRILIVTQVTFALGAFGLAALIGAGHVRLAHILVFTVLLGTTLAFDLPASQALIPDLVEPRQIPHAVQLMQAIFHGSRLVGPALAGWVIARYGTYSAFVANGLSFLPVIVTLLVIRPAARAERAPHGRALDAMREGFAYVRERPRLRALLGITALTTGLVFPNMVILMPFYAKNVLLRDADAVGALMSSGGGGALLGSMALLVVPEDGRVRRIGLALAGMVAGLFVIVGAPHLARPWDLATACAGAALVSFCISSALGLVATLLQQAAPDHLRGRVMSLQGFAFVTVMPVASLVLTKTVDVVTLPVEIVLAASLHAVLAVHLYRRLRAG